MPESSLVDPITLNITGQQYEEFVEALVDAFPAYGSLAMMARFRLDLALARVAGEGTPIDHVAYLLIEDQKAKGHFLRLVEAARNSRPANPKLAFFAEQFRLAVETPQKPALERVIKNTNSFLEIATWRERLGEIETRVCRVEVSTNAGMVYGTGFLVGDDLVLTNYHVVEAVVVGQGNQRTTSGIRARIADVVMRFDYKETAGGTNPGTEVRLVEIVDYSEFSPIDSQSPPKSADPRADQLDYALLRLETQPGVKAFAKRPIGDKPEREAPARGTIPIPPVDWPFQSQTPLFIVQHPDTLPLKLAFDTTSVIGLNGNNTRVTYATNTLGGSSGSPCFNQHLELIALHHVGDPKYAATYHPQYNQGIPISAIRERLKARGKAAELNIA